MKGVDVISQSLFAVVFSRAKNYSFSESSSSVFRLVTRKESDLKLCLNVKAARSWKKADQTRRGDSRKCAVFRCFNLLARFKFQTPLQQCKIILSSAFGRYCTYYVLLSVKSVELNLQPQLLIAVTESSLYLSDGKVSTKCSVLAILD